MGNARGLAPCWCLQTVPQAVRKVFGMRVSGDPTASAQELARLDRLLSYEVLDTPPDPAFYRCYEDVGAFPEVDLPLKTVYTRILTAFGAGLVPIL